MSRFTPPFASLLVGLSLALVPAAPAAAEEAPPTRRLLKVPGDLDIDLEARSAAQWKTADRFDVFTFFRFSDRRADSGIDFRHRIVDDAGKHYKMVHYDHGNGISAADVDGDGRPDLYLTTQVGSNRLYRNLGGGRFEDITEKAGVGVADKISVTGTFADVDDDGDADLYVTTVKMGNHFFENQGDGTFVDATARSGLGYVGHSSGATFFDYDRDGNLDLFLANVGVYTTKRQGEHGYFVGVDQAFSGHLFPERLEASILYRGRGDGTFEDVTAKVGLVDHGWTGDAAARDVDGDGWVDLYLPNMQGDDRFWRNVAGERFEDTGGSVFPKSPWGTMGVAFLDIENDGDTDLVLSDMHSDMSENVGEEREKLKSRMQWTEETLQGSENNIFGNALWENRDGTMVEVSDAMGVENYWPWGVSVADVNNDGWEDVLITSSMNYPFRYAVNSMLLNNAGKGFLDAEFLLGIEPRLDGRTTTEWFDLDCAGADREHDHCAGQDGPVTVLGALGTRSAVFLDLEGDGDLDLVTNDFNSEPLVLVSDLSEQADHHWLAIDLEGTASNRDGLGAEITVVAGDRRLRRVHDGKSGYLSQSALPVWIGLGEAAAVDRVEIRWPSGRELVLTEGIGIDRVLTVVEPAAAAAAESR